MNMNVMTHECIKLINRGYNIVEDSIEFGKDHQGRPSGEGWVTFQSLEDARRACLNKNQSYIGNRYIKLMLG